MSKKITVTLAAGVIGVLFLAAVNHGRSWKHNAPPHQQAGTSQPAVASLQSTRAAAAPAIPVSYRPLNFALLPGGFTSVNEFQQRVAKDPVLRSFYGTCADAHASMQALPNDIVVFVTFRRGKEIKWARKPLLVRKGEYVLTFCGKTVLARCGNLISWTPRQPSEDVPPGFLESPVDEFGTPEALALTAQAKPVPVPVPASGSGSGGFFSSFPTIFIPWTDEPATPSPPQAPTAIEGDEFVGHQALFTLLVGLFVIALLKLLTR